MYEWLHFISLWSEQQLLVNVRYAAGFFCCKYHCATMCNGKTRTKWQTTLSWPRLNFDSNTLKRSSDEWFTKQNCRTIPNNYHKELCCFLLLQYILIDNVLILPKFTFSLSWGVAVYNLALAYWPVASKYCSGPVIFLFTGPDWPVKNLDNIWHFSLNFKIWFLSADPAAVLNKLE